eukprot:scaffold77377_cov57-Phaeocystis_antarctica.AAC.1
MGAEAAAVAGSASALPPDVASPSYPSRCLRWAITSAALAAGWPCATSKSTSNGRSSGAVARAVVISPPPRLLPASSSSPWRWASSSASPHAARPCRAAKSAPSASSTGRDATPLALSCRAAADDAACCTALTWRRTWLGLGLLLVSVLGLGLGLLLVLGLGLGLGLGFSLV